MTRLNSTEPVLVSGRKAKRGFCISTGMSKYSNILLNRAMERIQSTCMFRRLFTGM